MAIFKCKMCGANLENDENETVAECEYCGTKQTIPTSQDENLQGLFNRANTLRLKGEFDKAESLYEKIIQSDQTQAEAYWGLILCKYGIEYVEDPKTFKRIPTCHRTSFDSVAADEDYAMALEHADYSQKFLYESEAAEIDRIQKEILALSKKEEPYDVFICYKETDESGKRTQDSVIANDIYYQLTQEGFKVFYAAITLENKLGAAYEPCIFAALNSAKIMLSIGTKPEYFNAVWVKNEWSRFLKMIKKDNSKMLIPCYRDMDAYELPDEFAHLQAQDMSKIGFINDLIRGVRKVLKVDDIKTEQSSAAVVNGGNVAVEPLLKRVFMYLEDGEWENADQYCERVLDLDPENANAYLGKLMVELHVHVRTNLKECEKPFNTNNNYAKIMRFADDALKIELEEDIRIIRERNEKIRVENVYREAVRTMDAANKSSAFYSVAANFESIAWYKDSREKAEECQEKAREYAEREWRQREEAQRIERERRVQEENQRKDDIYDNALNKLNSAKTEADVNEAYNMLDSIRSWKDAREKIKLCAFKRVEVQKRARLQNEIERIQKKRGDLEREYEENYKYISFIPTYRNGSIFLFAIGIILFLILAVAEMSAVGFCFMLIFVLFGFLYFNWWRKYSNMKREIDESKQNIQKRLDEINKEMKNL